MFRHSKFEVLSILKSTGLVPLFYHSDVNTCKSIIEVCYKGGIRAIEYTARGSASITVFEEISEYISINFPEMALGIGSITDSGAASLYLQSGADFIVTPVLRKDIAIVCNRRNTLWVPGCATLTEISKAEELGCDLIKLFPANITGPNFIKAIKGPQPWTNFMATGGIIANEDCIKEWFEAGVLAVGIGSDLISKNEDGQIMFELLDNKIKTTLSLIKKWKD